MAMILCLETATTNCSVALSVNGSVIAFREDSSPGFSHAEKLHVFIEEVLEESDTLKSQLSAIAVSKGPGSYTGLRIGVSAAKGLCYALNIPLISIPTLKSLASGSNVDRGLVVPMLDARRMEVYSAVFTSDNNEIRETRAEVLSQDSFSSYLEEGPITFLGSGVEKFKDICHHRNATFLNNRLPSSKDMVWLAEEKYKKSDFEDVAYFEPFYLKDFISN